jgi:hypothetical protein
MAFWRCVGITAVALTLASHAAAADDLTQFNAALEEVAAHNRVAIGYLRTDAVDLAVAEMEHMKDSWGVFSERFGGHRPAAFADNPRFTEALVDVPTRVVGAFLMLSLGRTDLAGNSLQGVREELSALRRASGVEVLADCILDANRAIETIAGKQEEPPNLTDPITATDLAAKAEAVRATLKRCDAVAPADVRDNPSFRRLIDGTLGALASVDKALETHDDALLAQTVDELRAFDYLLTLRYG